MSVPITSIVFQNSGVFSLEGGITTFGQTFLAGALRPGQTLLAEIGGQLVPVQVDVRNTHPDGSVKMAVLTMERPDLAPWQSAEAVLIAGDAAPAAPAVSLPGVLAGHSATLSLAIEGRAPLAIDVGKAVTEAIAAGTASFWQQGPLATQARVEIPLDNTSMRIVLDVTGYADGELRFTVGLNNDRAMEAVGGRLDYTAKVVLDGATLFEQSLSHHQYQRVALDFASSDKHGIQGLGAPDAGWLNIKHDIEYLKATNAVFQFNTEFEADPGRLRAYYDQITTDPRWGEVFWHHGVETYMPKTGGRPDIGFTTQANAHWLLSQDAAAGEYALAQARVAGYVPWNFYDLANGTVLNADAYPLLWTDPRGGTGRPGDATSRGLTQQVAASSETGWTPDRAHMPDLSFVPYLLTGERWIYDNVMTQASFSIMRAPSSAVGANGERLVIEGSQLRDGAWSMRQIEHAAWIAEDGSAEQAYFTQAAKENWDRILSMAPAWTETWGELAGFIPSSIHITYNGGEFPIWQTNMLAGVVALAAARGSEEARGVLDFMGNHLLGLVQSADKGFDPHNAAGYYTPFFVDGKPLTTWSAVADALKAKGAYTDSFKGGGEEYQRLMLASLSMAYHATGDERYREAAESFLKLAPPGATTAIYANLAQFAVTIPELHELYRADPRAPAAGFDPVTLVLGTGPDEIRLSISQDYYAGPVQYRIFIDGQQIGGTLTASALKSRSEADLVVLRGDFPDTLSLRVQMINDTYQGSTAQDRNLYVNAVSYNGVELPVRMALLNNTAQEASLSAGGRRWDEPPPAPAPEPQPEPPPPAPAPEPQPEPPPPAPAPEPFAPKTVELGSGPGAVIFKVSQDWYLAAAQYAVLVNGVQLGGVQEVSALRSSGQADTLIVRGEFGLDPTTIAIRFLNDGWGSSPGEDRNMYVLSASYNGASVPVTSRALYQTGHTATVSVSDTTASPPPAPAPEPQPEPPPPAPAPEPQPEPPPPAPAPEPQPEPPPPAPAPEPQPEPPPPAPAPEPFAPKTVELGSGPGAVIFKVSQDWYLAAAQYAVLVNGVQLGGVQEVSALRSSGQADTLIVRGEFGLDPTTIAIRFLNDGWGSSPGEDRNMYVLSASYNGASVPVTSRALYQTGHTATVSVSDTTASPPPAPAPEPQPEPPPPAPAPEPQPEPPPPAPAPEPQPEPPPPAPAPEPQPEPPPPAPAPEPQPEPPPPAPAPEPQPEPPPPAPAPEPQPEPPPPAPAPEPQPEPPPPAPAPEPQPEPPPPAPAPEPFAPKTVELGSGPGAVIFKVSQDWYLAAAQYAVLVNGVQLGGVQEVSALRSSGQADTLIVRGEFGLDPTTIAIRFLNDGWGSSPGEDRNMYVLSASYNGASVPVTSRALYQTGHTATVSVSDTTASPPPAPAPEPQPEPPPPAPAPEPQPEPPPPAPAPEPQPEPPPPAPAPEPQPEPPPPAPAPEPFAPKTVELGSGPGAVIFKVSQDWYLAAAQYAVLVNGVQLGGVQEVSALRSSGQADTLIVRGEFGLDPTTIAIRFLNDGWGSSPGEDRNMYVLSASYNGASVPVTSRALYQTGHTATVSVSDTTASPPPAPAPEPPLVLDPGHITVGTGNDVVSFSFTTNAASSGVVGIAVDGVVVFQGNLGSEHFAGDVAVKFNSGGSSQFNVWFEGASGVHLSQVSYNGINLAPLSQSMMGSGNAGFMLHTSPPGTNMAGSSGRDIFILSGGSVSVTTGSGRDLILVRDPGTYRIMDFNQQQDRILFEEMSRESLSVTKQGAHLVLGFEGGSITLHKGAKFDADQFILV